MKNKLLAVAIPAIFMTASAFAEIEGETSTIQFTGNITQATCSLDGESKGQSVQMGEVASNTFGGAGGVSNTKDFSIKLTGCDLDVATQASITFTGDTVNNDTTTLATSALDTTNVGIQILQNGVPLALDGSAASSAEELNADETDLKFAARYVALADDVSAGEANATASFTVNYE